MRIGLLVVLLICSNLVFAQDSILHLSSSMFNDESHDLGIADRPEWFYRQGHDSSWLKREINTQHWKRLNPHQINASMADATGRVEGWFHLRFSMDSTLTDIPLFIRNNTFAAMDIFVDGKFLASFGNTGIDDQANTEYRRQTFLPTPLALGPGPDHWLAIHYVDYTSPFTLNRLKSGSRRLTAIQLTKPEFTQVFITVAIKVTLYTTVWGTVCLVLSLLFWLMVLLNREEKSLVLIATSLTTLAVHIIFTIIPNSILGISFAVSTLSDYIAALGLVSYIALMPVVLAHVMHINVSRGGVVVLVLSAILMFISQRVPNPFTLISPVVPVLFCGYYFIKSWRTLRGAQVIVVISLLINGLFIAMAIVGFSLVYFRTYVDALPILTGVYLSFPIGLFIYIAVRFRENQDSIKSHLQQVISLEAEKRIQAETEQKRLEEEVGRQTEELRTSLRELKSTQSQLIQSEKMASLGELTAGIAHEIQNPLNFVNNFSEVSNELIGELKTELATGNRELATELANNISSNLEKINHHGKRADAIVKSMLQHSRTSSGKKELTDINALCDEYLRLAYHGYRAKDKSFNAKFEAHLDPSLPKVNVVAQDMGRVVLNLINNAFYAVSEKLKVESQKSDNSYEPTVTVSTKNLGEKIQIRVKDNGSGIPEAIKEKIFQPFFTTKPTGQGTGLGLSLSYDIVSKGHGGELKMEASDGTGSVLTITLPIT